MADMSPDDERGLEESDEAAFARWKTRALEAEGEVERLREIIRDERNPGHPGSLAYQLRAALAECAEVEL